MLPLLATEADASDLGVDATSAALDRASARIRGFLQQQVTVGESEITARGPIFRLPERPVRAVLSVADSHGDSVAFEVSGSLVEVDSLGLVTVSYAHGYIEVPDEIIELTCQIAARLSTDQGDLAKGVQQQTAGPFQQSFGWDAWKAQSGLTAGDKETLARYWPRLPQVPIGGAP